MILFEPCRRGGYIIRGSSSFFHNRVSLYYLKIINHKIEGYVSFRVVKICEILKTSKNYYIEKWRYFNFYLLLSSNEV